MGLFACLCCQCLFVGFRCDGSGHGLFWALQVFLFVLYLVLWWDCGVGLRVLVLLWICLDVCFDVWGLLFRVLCVRVWVLGNVIYVFAFVYGFASGLTGVDLHLITVFVVFVGV